MSGSPNLDAALRSARELRDGGDLDSAEILLTQAVGAGSAAYGAGDPDVLEVSRLLASVLRDQGEVRAARRTLEDAVDAGRLTLADDDPLLVLLVYDLGMVAAELGNRHEMLRNLGWVALVGPDVLGPAHPAVRAAAAYAGIDDGPPDVDPDPPHRPQQTPHRPQETSDPPQGAVYVPQNPDPDPDHDSDPARNRVTPDDGWHQRPQHEEIQSRPESGFRRTAAVVVLVVAVVTAVAGLTAAVVALGPWRQAAPPPNPSGTLSAPSTTSPAPDLVRLRDDGSSIVLSWRDPSSGTVPFIVAGGRAGEQSRPFANLPAGTTDYTLNGLNPRLEYCFTVVAVYATDSLAVSDLVCTRRGTATPTARTSSTSPTSPR